MHREFEVGVLSGVALGLVLGGAVVRIYDDVRSYAQRHTQLSALEKVLATVKEVMKK